jgi:hypothetical protein
MWHVLSSFAFVVFDFLTSFGMFKCPPNLGFKLVDLKNIFMYMNFSPSSISLYNKCAQISKQSRVRCEVTSLNLFSFIRITCNY